MIWALARNGQAIFWRITSIFDGQKMAISGHFV